MRLAEPREELVSARREQAIRENPLPIKCLVLARYEPTEAQEKAGEPGTPMMIRKFWVCAGAPKMCSWFDRDCEEHQYELTIGQLDFSHQVVTVQDETYDEDGKYMDKVCVSHDLQRSPNLSEDSPTNFRNGIIAYRAQALARSPNAKLIRFWPDGATAKNGLSKIMILWQQQADSDECFWLDGSEPTEEQALAQQKEWADRDENRERARSTSAPRRERETANTGGPADIENLGLGDNF
jgi:hypothetical protein